MGELSYPIYLLHTIVVVLVKAFASDVGIIIGGGSALIITIMLDALFVRWLERPMNAYHHRRLDTLEKEGQK